MLVLNYYLKRKEEIYMVQFCTYRKVVRTYRCQNTVHLYVRVQKYTSLLGMIHDCVNINLNLHTSTTVVKFRNALASSTADALCGESSFKSWHTFPVKEVNFACAEVRVQICYLENNVIVTTCASTR
jgi:hypothetical protein